MLLKPVQQRIATLNFNLNLIVYALPCIVFVFAIVDVYLYKHLSVFSALSLIITFTILTLSSKRGLDIALFGIATLVIIIAVLYSIYILSFGNDTWHDVIQAMQIVEKRGLRDSTVFHTAYSFPLIPLLYAVHSIVTNVDTIWSSNVMGILYITFYLPYGFIYCLRS
jgi:uncharacterized membrane protein